MRSLTVKAQVKEYAFIKLWKRPVGAERWEFAACGWNHLPNGGAQRLWELAFGSSTTYFDYLALGSGTTAPADSDTALVTELSDSRVQLTGKTIANKRATLKVYFGPSYGNGTIAEWGLFTAASGGTMLDRGLVSPTVTKDDTEEMLAEVILDLDS